MIHRTGKRASHTIKPYNKDMIQQSNNGNGNNNDTKDDTEQDKVRQNLIKWQYIYV